MINDFLNNKTTNKKVDSHYDKKVIKEIAKLFEKYENCLTKKENEYLINFSFNTSNFYGLPKMYWSKIIQRAIKEH